MDLMTRRRAMMQMLSGQAPHIPAAYQRVEWIGTNGNQFIWLKDVVSAAVPPQTIPQFRTDGWACTMIAQNNGQAANTSGAILAWGDNQGYWIGQRGSVYTQNGADITTPCELSVSWMESGMVTTSSYREYTTQYGPSPPYHTHLMIFGIPTRDGKSASYKARVKLYSLSITKAGTPFRNYIPCYRKADGTIGLFDTVTSSFATNDGTGAFSRGADI